jgi:hypothetical protein
MLVLTDYRLRILSRRGMGRFNLLYRSNLERMQGTGTWKEFS